LRGPGNLPSAASVKCAHAPARRTDEESPHAPTTDMAGQAPLSYMYFHHWSVLGSRNPFLAGHAGQLKSTSLFGLRISRWMEATEKLPRFHRRALQFGVSRHPASETHPTVQPVAIQFNTTSSVSRKIAWRMYPTSTSHTLTHRTHFDQPVKVRI
jgi:hypothetical protein